MAVNLIELGKRIKRYRTERKMSQDDLGSKIETSRLHIGRIEAGSRTPSLELLVSIANELHVSVDDLLTDSLIYSRSESDREINDILWDCNQDEKEILIKMLRYMKQVLSEHNV